MRSNTRTCRYTHSVQQQQPTSASRLGGECFRSRPGSLGPTCLLQHLHHAPIGQGTVQAGRFELLDGRVPASLAAMDGEYEPEPEPTLLYMHCTSHWHGEQCNTQPGAEGTPSRHEMTCVRAVEICAPSLEVMQGGDTA